MRRRAQQFGALVALAAVLTASLWFFAAPPAVACSCEGISATAIERGDAGLVGTITSMLPIAPEWEDQERFVARVQVQTDLKDNLADVVYVTSEVDDGGNCGVSWQTGLQIAAVIYHDNGVLRTDSCSTMSADMAQAWQPAASVGGTAVVLIGGELPYRMVAYDESAVPIAYAFGPGAVRSASVCPGGEVLLELVDNYPVQTKSIDTRSLSTFEVISSIEVGSDSDPIFDVRCDSADGTVATTNGFVLIDGEMQASTEQFAPIRFDTERFWPHLETDVAEPIATDWWMSLAIELDEPVEVSASDRTSPVVQLGSGETFGLGQEVEGELVDEEPGAAPNLQESEAPPALEQPPIAPPAQTDGEPLVRQGPIDAASDRSWAWAYWLGGISLIALLGYAAFSWQRTET